MTSELGSNPEQERQLTQEPKEAHSAEEIQQYFEFADAILGVDWGEEGPPEIYTPQYIAAHPEEAQLFVLKDIGGNIVGGIKTKVLDEADKERLSINIGALASKNGILLEYAAIKEELQNQGLVKPLWNKAAGWGKEHGAEYMASEAEIDNPRSVYIQLRGGSKIVSIQPPGMGVPNPYFVLIDYATEPSPSEDDKPEWQEVVVTPESYDELKQLFGDGWVGVDIKGPPENPDNDDSWDKFQKNKWTLILEKANN